MSKLKQLSSNFLWLALTIILVFGVAFSLGRPTIRRYTSNKARSLIAAADRGEAANPQRSLGEYRLAEILDPSSIADTKAANLFLTLDRPDDAIATLNRHPSTDKLLLIANIQFDSGNYEAALQALNKVTPVNPQALALKTRALLELGRIGDAIQTSSTSADSSLALLLGLSNLMAGDSVSAQTLISALGTLEPAETLRQASSDKLSLAKVLYAQGLLRSSEQAFKSQLDNSEAYLLLAQIKLVSRQPNAASLAEAANALKTGLAIDPANLALHQLLAQVDSQQGDNVAADHQRQLIDELQSGKI